MVGALSASLFEGVHSIHSLQDPDVGENRKKTGNRASLAGIEIWSADYGLVHSFHPDDSISPECAAGLRADPHGFVEPAVEPSDTLFVVDRMRRSFLRHPCDSRAAPPFITAEGFREAEWSEPALPLAIRLLSDALTGFLTALPAPGCRGLVTGTPVACEQGELPVEAILPGMRVKIPGGVATVQAVARTPVSQFVLDCLPRFAPVLFPEHTLGNAAAFSLAPDQGLRVGGHNVEYDFGETEVLVAAREFTPLTKAHAESPSGGTTYHNLILSTPAPVQVGHIWTETINLADVAPDWLPRLHAAGLVSGILCTGDGLGHQPATTRLLRRFEAQSLLYELTRDGGAISRAAFAFP